MAWHVIEGCRVAASVLSRDKGTLRSKREPAGSREENLAEQVPKAITRMPPGREKATRQQGGFFLRENSSNGGKAIRTFLAS